jgi:hypothetical protein
MFIVFDTDRPSDSPFVERVWTCHSERGGTFRSVAMSHWEMVVSRVAGRTSLTVRGPETRASLADCPADGQWLAIRFKIGTYMPHLRPGVLRDRNDATLPAATDRSFWLGGRAWEYPTVDNAETFVRRLVRDELVVRSPSVTRAGTHSPSDDDHGRALRTVQRQFRHAAGVTRVVVRQIERARRATILLAEGKPISDVVGTAGYFDQAHLTRSLKRFVGLTPAQVIRAEQQLSFLYNTSPT